MKEIPLFNQNNPYGYKLNVNHPLISRHYDRYKVKHNIYLIPSDEERREFESYMIPLLMKQKEPKNK